MAKAPVSPVAVHADFKDAFPEQAHGPNESGGGSASARKRDRAVRDAYKRINRQGWEDVTIVNLNSFKLDLNMGYIGHLTVPAKKQGELYAILTITQPRFDMKDLGDGNFEPIAVVPKEMAQDLIDHFKDKKADDAEDWEAGRGVFFYMGTGPVKDHEDLLEEALRHQVDWYWQLLHEGNGNWAAFNKNPRQISDRMRDAAKELYRLKLINHQPEWITVSKNESPDGPCEGCGTVISKLAKFCVHCHQIFDVEWVRAKRPDLWRRQQSDISTVVAGTATDAPDIEELIKEEENAD